MASHMLVYCRLHDKRPTYCFDSLNDTIAAELKSEGYVIVRMLTGCCPLCNTSVSKLSGVNDPLPVGYEA